MAYIIDSSSMEGCFSVPKCAVDHLKFANHICLKVLIWIMANLTDGINEEKIAAALSIDVSEVREALQYWCSAGVLINLGGTASISTPAEKAKQSVTRTVARPVKPSREEAAKRGLESKEIAFMLKEAELRFGRTLRQNEISTLVWLYDDEGLNAAAILMIIEYALSENRCNIGFIERTAVDWINKGITDIKDIEKEISVMRVRYSAWHTVSSAMGIERRSPSSKELEDAYKWVDEWHYSREMLKAAYDRSIDSISKFSMPYIRKIIEKWHKDGIKTIDDLKQYEEKQADGTASDTTGTKAGYDLKKALDSMY